MPDSYQPRVPPLPLAQVSPETLAGIQNVLTDMDDTLTHDGRLPPETFMALADLRDVGIRVIPVTAAPAGWCDQMVRMWPVDAVIGENGGVYFHCPEGTKTPDRIYWHGEEDRLDAERSLLEIRRSLPDSVIAADQPFRLTSLALNAPKDAHERQRLKSWLEARGCTTTLNNLWLLGWIGDYTKLEMSRRLLSERFGVNLDRQAEQLIYVGDSLNDEPMFAALPYSVGVSTVVDYLPEMRHPPRWITQAPGGYGFVELARAILKAHKRISNA